MNENRSMDMLDLHINAPHDLTAPELQIAFQKIIDKDVLRKIKFTKYSTNRAPGSILIAAITVSGTVLVALITAIIKIVQILNANQITFKRNRNETVLIVPANTPPEKYAEYLDILKEMGKLDVFIE